jgi:ABC-type uncharacterized transport system auxiliary subunit
MPSAAKLLMIGVAASALAACHKQPQPAANQELSIEDNVATGQIPPDAQIETLPPDDSSDTSSGELAKGEDNPDVNDVNSSSTSH